MNYLPSLKLYIGKQEIFTEEEMEEADRLEKEWLHSQKRLSTFDLAETFPEAKRAVEKNTKENIASLKKRQEVLREVIREQTEQMNRDPQNAKLYKSWIEDSEKQIVQTDKKIKRLAFYKAAWQKPKAELLSGKITDGDIERAKEVAIEGFYDNQLVKSGRRLAGLCEFHEDRTPSFTIYTDQNRWYCFSCAEGGDVISYVQKKYHLEFIDAIKRILKK